MKQTLTAVALLVILSMMGSCTDKEKSREIVESSFPNSKKIIQFGWEFVVIDSSYNVYKVGCLNETNDDISYCRKVYQLNR